MPRTLIKVSEKKDFKKRKVIFFEDEGLNVIIIKVKKRFYAIDKRCTHAGGNLGKGILRGTQITCPVHGATFDLDTGELIKNDRISEIMFETVENTITYPVIIKGEDIFLEIDAGKNFT